MLSKTKTGALKVERKRGQTQRIAACTLYSPADFRVIELQVLEKVLWFQVKRTPVRRNGLVVSPNTSAGPRWVARRGEWVLECHNEEVSAESFIHCNSSVLSK